MDESFMKSERVINKGQKQSEVINPELLSSLSITTTTTTTATTALSSSSCLANNRTFVTNNVATTLEANNSMIIMPPCQFICPLSRNIMIDPVVDTCGHSFERKAIYRWVRTNGWYCPISQKPYRDDNGHSENDNNNNNNDYCNYIRTNHKLAERIEKWNFLHSNEYDHIIQQQMNIISSNAKSSILYQDDQNNDIDDNNIELGNMIRHHPYYENPLKNKIDFLFLSSSSSSSYRSIKAITTTSSTTSSSSSILKKPMYSQQKQFIENDIEQQQQQIIEQSVVDDNDFWWLLLLPQERQVLNMIQDQKEKQLKVIQRKKCFNHCIITIGTITIIAISIIAGIEYFIHYVIQI